MRLTQSRVSTHNQAGGRDIMKARYFTFNNKVYDTFIFFKKVVPKLLRLIHYIKDTNKDYFTKQELLNIYNEHSLGRNLNHG